MLHVASPIVLGSTDEATVIVGRAVQGASATNVLQTFAEGGDIEHVIMTSGTKGNPLPEKY